uniref:Uncharacterized protein n=1 Tax=Tanacetum cinerariifolium TaxID=118510 RepID=A0A6L2JBQ1_TANCI|nr:hypothetical protein [Tanacetum cinerariifolium]
MTDHSLWEIILNDDSPAPTRVIKGVVQPIAPITAEKRLARKNELKARGTLLMALPDKHQLKFNIHKDAKTLMKAIEKRFRGNMKTKKVPKTLLKQQYENFIGLSSKSLDQIHDRLQKLISQLEILGESLSQEDLNLKFLRSLPTKWRTHTLIWRNKTDLEEQSLDDFTNKPVSVVASVFAVSAKSPVFALLNIDANNLEEMDLKWQLAMLTVRVRQFLQRTRRNLKANGPTYIEFDMSKVECYNCHRKGHFARSVGLLRIQERMAEEEPTNYALMAFTSSSSSSDNELRDNALVVLRQNLEKEEQERDDLKLKLEKYQSGDGYHAVPPPYTRKIMPPKPDLVFHDVPNVNKTVHTAFNVELSPPKPNTNLSHTQRPSAPIIKDWVSDSNDDSEAEIP